MVALLYRWFAVARLKADGGANLLGLTTNFSAAYLPSNYTYYSIIFTFVLVAVVLAVKPLGLFGRPA